MIRKTDAFAATLLLFLLAFIGIATGAKGFFDGADEDKKLLPASSSVEMSEENKPPPLQVDVLQNDSTTSVTNTEGTVLGSKDYGNPPKTATDPDVEDDLSGVNREPSRTSPTPPSSTGLSDN